MVRPEVRRGALGDLISEAGAPGSDLGEHWCHSSRFRASMPVLKVPSWSADQLGPATPASSQTSAGGRAQKSPAPRRSEGGGLLRLVLPRVSVVATARLGRGRQATWIYEVLGRDAPRVVCTETTYSVAAATASDGVAPISALQTEASTLAAGRTDASGGTTVGMAYSVGSSPELPELMPASSVVSEARARHAARARASDRGLWRPRVGSPLWGGPSAELGSQWSGSGRVRPS